MFLAKGNWPNFDISFCLVQGTKMSPSSSSDAIEDHKLRPFHCELDVLSRPDGSAIVSQGT